MSGARDWARAATTAIAALAMTACGGSTATSDGGGTTPDAASPATFAEQVALGASVYGAECASCHGAGGEGTESGPRLVGLAEGALPLEPRPGAVRTSRFVTVADVAAFAVANMPADAPGSLTAEQYWAILAFDLSANGITLEEPLTPELAATLTIPR
jgi:mono/diheme cytochrome c family protein